jgi:hypothetical protein
MWSLIHRPYDTKTGWGNLFDGLVLFMEGAIVSISIIGPAKHLFVKNQQYEINKPIKSNNCDTKNVTQ